MTQTAAIGNKRLISLSQAELLLAFLAAIRVFLDAAIRGWPRRRNQE